jgi:cyclic pyranopterin phosphate synthase
MPLTHNFCEDCNRVRLTCTGTLYMGLGQEDAADLPTSLWRSESDESLQSAINEAISRKPRGTTSLSTATTTARQYRGTRA